MYRWMRGPCLADVQLSTLLTVVLFGDISAKTAISSALLRRLLRGYEKLPPPGARPVVVELGVYINYFYDISDITMDYTLSIYLRQQWYDHRLKFNSSHNLNSNKLKAENYSQIWVPDTIFGNEKFASLHQVTSSNALLYIHSDGRIWYVSKVSALLSCPMKLHKFPMDVQTCPMLLQSYGYSTDEVVYKWLEPKESAVQFDPTTKFLPQYTVEDFNLGDCTFNDSTAFPPGNYTCLETSFIIHRGLIYYLIQYYIPSVLLVVLSWLSFWISIDAVVARVSIGLLTVLSLSLQSTNSQFQLPQVSYIKAIDVWMSACLIFVFSSLIEFAIVNVWSRKEVAGQLGAEKKAGEENKGIEEAEKGRGRRVAEGTDRDHCEDNRKNSGKVLTWGGVVTDEDCELSLMQRPSQSSLVKLEDSVHLHIEDQEGVSSGRYLTTPMSSHSDHTPSRYQRASTRRQSTWREGLARRQSVWREEFGRRRLSSAVLRRMSMVAETLKVSRRVRQARAIDDLARKLFPSAFLIFNVIYWLTYKFF